jgi:hypothetical protein
MKYRYRCKELAKALVFSITLKFDMRQIRHTLQCSVSATCSDVATIVLEWGRGRGEC